MAWDGGAASAVSRVFPTTPMTVYQGAPGRPRNRFPRAAWPVGSFQNCSAVRWLMIASPPRCDSSRSKVRPASSGIPITLKYSPSIVVKIWSGGIRLAASVSSSA
jgi:hypothetical protein